MGLLSLYIGTVAASAGIEVSTLFKLYKEAAMEGFKIDPEKLKEINISELTNSNSVGTLLVPGVNLSKGARFSSYVREYKDGILKYLATEDALLKMTKIENEEFAYKPTGLNAMIISINSKNSKKVVLDEESYISYYRRNGSIEFNDIQGKALDMTMSELRSLAAVNEITELLKAKSEAAKKMFDLFGEQINEQAVAAEAEETHEMTHASDEEVERELQEEEEVNFEREPVEMNSTEMMNEAVRVTFETAKNKTKELIEEAGLDEKARATIEKASKTLKSAKERVDAHMDDKGYTDKLNKSREELSSLAANLFMYASAGLSKASDSLYEKGSTLRMTRKDNEEENKGE